MRLLLDPGFRHQVLDYCRGPPRIWKQGIIRASAIPTCGSRRTTFVSLRAVRFAARFGFRYRTGHACVLWDALHALVPDWSRPERVREELCRILTEGAARRGFELLDQTGLLQQILPEVAAMKGVEQPPEYHPEGDVWVHTLMMLEHLPQSPPLHSRWAF